jgi:sarcosine oxidase subunit alpha
MRRLPQQPGEWIDRSRPLAFTFEGERCEGFAGDTISSALLAGGTRVLGRSFKYHRPRSVLSLANHDVNAMFQLRHRDRSVPNVRGDVTLLEDGMELHAVNTSGGLARDRRAFLDRLAPFLPVGFYYKAFHGKGFAKWERRFRELTGLGEVDLGARHLPSAKRYDFADVLVVGAGASGLSAALRAASAGCEVLLVDEQPRLGAGFTEIAPQDPVLGRRMQALVEQVQDHPRIRCMTSTVAAGCYADHWVALETAERMIKVRARAVVFAQGAIEQPAVFRNNDLPGILLAGAARRLLHRYAVAPASHVAVLTANADGYVAALDALDAGIAVAAVVDLRVEPGPRSEPLRERLRSAGVECHLGVVPVEATRAGQGAVGGLTWTSAAGAATGGLGGAGGNAMPGPARAARASTLAVDGIWVSVGYAPANGLLHQAGARMRYDADVEQFVPDALPPGIFACGRVNGHYDVEARLGDGRRAGEAAAAWCGAEHAEVGTAATVTMQLRPSDMVAPESPTHPYPIFTDARGKDFVDFDEDIQCKDLVNAMQEGFDSPELMKRYTTVGMGPSQGKHSNMNALRVLARTRGQPVAAFATTTARPFHHPIAMRHLAGRGFTPLRRTPLDARHERDGAVWMPAGNWRRPEYFARARQSRTACIEAEVRAVRAGVGIVDVGTLGKIEAHGPAAGEFLDRVYAGRFSNLKVGATRYGLMLDESGVVLDDGVVARLADELFYFTTTTGNSATIYRELGRLAALWGLPVGLVNVTGHLAAFNIAGPRSRELLARLTSADLSQAAFPYLGAREIELAGVPVRALRVGFVGELGYEIHAPANAAAALYEQVLAAGADLGIVPFGVEAQRMLRLEKGHVIVGQDTDGLTNPLQIGADWALKMDKAFFIGQRSLRILARQAEARAGAPHTGAAQQLTGFTADASQRDRLRESHLVIDGGEIAGRITSVGLSPTLNKVIGLAFVAPAVLARGGPITIRGQGGALVTVQPATLPFYDAAGLRQKQTDGAQA